MIIAQAEEKNKGTFEEFSIKGDRLEVIAKVNIIIIRMNMVLMEEAQR